jgi:hypothetical protein
MLNKTSSNDQHLLPFLANTSSLCSTDLVIKLLCRREIRNFDAVIATGSNNTARYFEYYFKEKPSIRKVEIQLLVLDGKETKSN